MAIIACSVLTLSAIAQGGEGRAEVPAWLLTWVRECERVPGCKVEWHTGIPSHDAAGVPVGVMRFKHTILYRWPDCMLREQEYLGGGPETPGAQQHGMAALFDRSIVITPDAQRWQIRATQTGAPELGVPLDSQYVMAREIPSAPWLIGRWMLEHPDGWQAQPFDADRTRVVATSLRIRVDFARDGDSAIVRSIDEFQNGIVVLRYEFDDYREIPDWPGRMGHARTFFSPGTGGELEVVHVDSLVNAKIEPALLDAEFVPTKTRLGSRLPGLLTQMERQTPVMPLEPASAGDMQERRGENGATRGFAARWWPWAIGVAIAAALVAIWFVLARKAQRAGAADNAGR